MDFGGLSRNVKSVQELSIPLKAAINAILSNGNKTYFVQNAYMKKYMGNFFMYE